MGGVSLLAEVQELAGVRHARKTGGEAGCRYSRHSGSVRISGQRLGIRVPRVRGEGGAIPLRRYRQLHAGGGNVEDDLRRRVLDGISCGNDERAASAVPGAIELSGSSVYGERPVPSGVEGSRTTVLSSLLRALWARGLDVSPGILVIIASGKGLRSAVRRVFAQRARVQRCQ